MLTPAVLERVRVSGYRTQLALPIPVNGQTWGVMALISKEARTFEADELTLLEAVAHQVGQVVARAFDYSADVGSLASQAQLDKVSAHVADAVAKGATVVAGGQPLPEVGPYAYAPTVLEGVTDEMDLCLGETFGPVVALYRVGNDTEALEVANQGEAGLSASVFSKSLQDAETVARGIRAGAVNINDGAALAAGSIEAGMGGMGSSGLGRRHGADGIRKYTDAQTIAASKMGPIGPFKGQSIAAFVKIGNGQLKALRKMGMR